MTEVATPKSIIENLNSEIPNYKKLIDDLFKVNVNDTYGLNISNWNSPVSFYGSDTSCFIATKPSRKKDYPFKNIQSVEFVRQLTQKWFEINRLISQIFYLQEVGNVENTLDYIFNTIDDLLINSQFNLVNTLLEVLDVKKLDINISVGILTITSKWREKLTSRRSFYLGVYEFLNTSYLTDETNQILGGLE